MVQSIEDHDLVANWSLSFDELALIGTKRHSVRLGFAVLLRFRRLMGQFPKDRSEVPPEVIAYLAQQTGSTAEEWDTYDLTLRSSRRHRSDILAFLGIQRLTGRDIERAAAWIVEELCPLGLSPSEMIERVVGWFADQRIACLEEVELDRLVATAQRRFEEQVLAAITASLSPTQKVLLDSSLTDKDPVTGFSGLKADPGEASLDNILLTAQRLEFVRSLELPVLVLPNLNAPISKMFRRRVANEMPWPMRQHPETKRYGLYVNFLSHRQREITDGLVDLLVDIIHKIGAQAKRTVIRTLTRDVEKVYGKETILFRIAEASTAKPDGSVRDVVFPAVGGESVLSAIMKEYKAGGTFERKVHAVLRASYAKHYRRMLPAVLTTLKFQSNNAAHRPVLEALNWLQRHHKEQHRRVIRIKFFCAQNSVLKPNFLNRASVSISAVKSKLTNSKCEAFVIGHVNACSIIGEGRRSNHIADVRRMVRYRNRR
ncbi:DUF4158 domain-containing protein [Brucella sp. TWI432]